MRVSWKIHNASFEALVDLPSSMFSDCESGKDVAQSLPIQCSNWPGVAFNLDCISGAGLAVNLSAPFTSISNPLLSMMIFWDSWSCPPMIRNEHIWNLTSRKQKSTFLLGVAVVQEMFLHGTRGVHAATKHSRNHANGNVRATKKRSVHGDLWMNG